MNIKDLIPGDNPSMTYDQFYQWLSENVREMFPHLSTIERNETINDENILSKLYETYVLIEKDVVLTNRPQSLYEDSIYTGLNLNENDSKESLNKTKEALDEFFSEDMNHLREQSKKFAKDSEMITESKKDVSEGEIEKLKEEAEYAIETYTNEINKIDDKKSGYQVAYETMLETYKYGLEKLQLMSKS